MAEVDVDLEVVGSNVLGIAEMFRRRARGLDGDRFTSDLNAAYGQALEGLD